MSMSRKVWQDFKKKYPQFEKYRKVKVDVGPQIDKYISESQKIIKMMEAIEAKIKSVKPSLAKVETVFEEYHKVAELIDKSWPEIEKDINKRRGPKIAKANAKSEKTGKEVEPKYSAFEQAMIDVMDSFRHGHVLSDFNDLQNSVREDSGRFKSNMKTFAKAMQKYDVDTTW